MATTDVVPSASSAASPVESENEKYGFKRDEMYDLKLAGSMGDAYDRHVFICYKNPSSWVSHLETSEADPFAVKLAEAFKARRSEMAIKTRITICEGSEGTEFEDGDALIFPDMVQYKGLTEANVESFVVEVLMNGKSWTFGKPTALKKSHIFVCAHGSRDKRCGVCGPALIKELKSGLSTRGLSNQIAVSACSHVGGHKYAGNVIVFNPDSQGKVSGYWYGYVTPDDVPNILDGHIGKGIVIEKLLRGQMGEKAVQVIENGTSGCCQGGNGVSCCRDGSSEKKGVGKWCGIGEHLPLYAAIAAAGAVVAISAAHVFYNKSR